MTQSSAADRKEVRAAEKAAHLADVARLEFTRHIMSNSSGREWMWELLTRCGIFHSPMTDSDRWTAHACGQQDIGRMILADVVAAAPDQYVLAMREADVRRTLAEQRLGPRPGRDTEQPDSPADASAGAEDGADDPADRYVDYDATSLNPARH